MDSQRQTPLLKAINKAYEWTYLVMTTDAQGQNVGRSDDGEAKSYEDRAYVQQVMAGQPNGQQVLISKTTGEPAVCLSGPVQRGGNVAGALVACSELNDVSEAVTDVKIGERRVGRSDQRNGPRRRDRRASPVGRTHGGQYQDGLRGTRRV